MARLRTMYESEVKPKLKERLGLENEMALPRLEKITLSCGVGGAKDNKKLLKKDPELSAQLDALYTRLDALERPQGN